MNNPADPAPLKVGILFDFCSNLSGAAIFVGDLSKSLKAKCREVLEQVSRVQSEAFNGPELVFFRECYELKQKHAKFWLKKCIYFSR